MADKKIAYTARLATVSKEDGNWRKQSKTRQQPRKRLVNRRPDIIDEDLIELDGGV